MLVAEDFLSDITGVLFSYCQHTDLNVWRLVCQLERPQTFANFIETGEHVSPEDREKYQQALHTGDFSSSVEETLQKMSGLELPDGHRFTCHVCNSQLQGHRFHCGHCYIAM